MVNSEKMSGYSKIQSVVIYFFDTWGRYIPRDLFWQIDYVQSSSEHWFPLSNYSGVQPDIALLLWAFSNAFISTLER